MKKNSNQERLTQEQQEVQTLLDSVKEIDDVHKQIATLEQALALAEDIKWQYGISRANKMIGIRYQKTSALEGAIPYFLKALEIGKVTGDKKLELSARDELAITYLLQGNPAKALESQFVNLELVKNDGPSSDLALTLINIGTSFDSLGLFDMAIEYTQESLKVEREIGGNESIALMNLGLDYIAFKKYSVALDYLTQALETAKKWGDKEDLAKVSGDLCLVYTKLGLYEKAELAGQESVATSKVTNNLEDQCRSLVGLGGALEEQGKNHEAIDLYSKAIETSLPAGESIFLCEAKFSLGCALIKTGDLIAAIKIISECLLFTSKNGFKIHESKCHQKLTELYAKKGELEKELNHVKKHYELERAIYDEKSANRLIANQIKYDIEKKDNENMLLKFKSDELERQLSDKAIAYASQTELLATFREDLRRIIRKIEVRDPAINELIAKLRELPESVNWKEFEEQFRHVHPEFKTNLKKKFPELSEDELQVCALFRLKLKAPDIGKLLSLSYRTVQNRRNRIRKKLGLKPDDDIAKFLGTF